MTKNCGVSLIKTNFKPQFFAKKGYHTGIKRHPYIPPVKIEIQFQLMTTKIKNVTRKTRQLKNVSKLSISNANLAKSYNQKCYPEIYPNCQF